MLERPDSRLWPLSFLVIILVAAITASKSKTAQNIHSNPGNLTPRVTELAVGPLVHIRALVDDGQTGARKPRRRRPGPLWSMFGYATASFAAIITTLRSRLMTGSVLGSPEMSVASSWSSQSLSCRSAWLPFTIRLLTDRQVQPSQHYRFARDLHDRRL